MNEQERRPVEVGQRWITAGGGIETIKSIDGNRVNYESHSFDWLETFSNDPEYRCVSDAPSPAKACKAPEGYVLCRLGCGRYCKPVPGCPMTTTKCNHCYAEKDGDDFAFLEEKYGPDWTPPAPVPTATNDSVTATAGQCTADLIHWAECTEYPYCAHRARRAGIVPSPPAQEAPKARQCWMVHSVHHVNVAYRHWRNMFRDPCEGWVCDTCYLRECEPKGSGSGTPYTGPERLERQKLAHTCELGGDVAL